MVLNGVPNIQTLAEWIRMVTISLRHNGNWWSIGVTIPKWPNVSFGGWLGKGICVAKHFRLVNYQKQIKMQVKALKLLPLRKTELPVPLHQKPRTAAAHEHQRKVPPWNLKGDMMVHHRVLGESIFSKPISYRWLWAQQHDRFWFGKSHVCLIYPFLSSPARALSHPKQHMGASEYGVPVSAPKKVT